jgi:hypothetical protein
MLAVLAVVEPVTAHLSFAFGATGLIQGTEIEFSDLQVSKGGVSVKLSNVSQTDVKVSLGVTFHDAAGNEVGHSLFGLREIQAGRTVDISANHLTGKWRDCREAPRAEWRKMTYEYLY